MNIDKIDKITIRLAKQPMDISANFTQGCQRYLSFLVLMNKQGRPK